jgi:hypothetical protein
MCLYKTAVRLSQAKYVRKQPPVSDFHFAISNSTPSASITPHFITSLLPISPAISVGNPAVSTWSCQTIPFISFTSIHIRQRPAPPMFFPCLLYPISLTVQIFCWNGILRLEADYCCVSRPRCWRSGAAFGGRWSA